MNLEPSRELNWDDLRLVLAVARQGTLSGAARALGVTHSTVFRRLNALELQVGVRLFERYRDGYAPTPAGDQAVAVAQRVTDDVMALERGLSGQDQRPSGTVRIATTHTLAIGILMPHLAALRAAHPEIEIELAMANEMANLTRREADMAVRPTNDPPETLIGRRVSDIAYAIYAAPDYLSLQRGTDWFAQRWIGYDDILASTAAGRWLSGRVPTDCYACRLDSVTAMREAARAGMGLALLPCYLGDSVDGLRRVERKVLPEPRTGLWLLTHKDLRRTARIRAVMDFLGTSIATERTRFLGTASARLASPRTRA
jgi:DNA-binding transcriptional LysR family regulator